MKDEADAIPDETEPPTTAIQESPQGTKTPAKDAFVAEIARQQAEAQAAKPEPAIKTVQPKAEAKEGDVPAAIKGESARENFKRLEQSAHEWRIKAEAHEKKLAEAEAKLKAQESTQKPDPTDIEATKKERDEYKGIVKQLYIENDPEFQATFQPRIQAALDDAKAAAGDRADEVEQLLALPQTKATVKAIKEIATTLDDFERARLVMAMDRLSSTVRERNAVLKASKDNLAAHQRASAERESQLKAQQKQQADNFKNQALEQAAKMEALEGDEDKDAPGFRAEWVKKAVDKDYPVDEMVKMPALAAEATRLRERVVPGLRQKIKDLEAQVASLQGSSPSLGGKETTSTKEPPKAGVVSPFEDEGRPWMKHILKETGAI